MQRQGGALSLQKWSDVVQNCRQLVGTGEEWRVATGQVDQLRPEALPRNTPRPVRIHETILTANNVRRGGARQGIEHARLVVRHLSLRAQALNCGGRGTVVTVR